MKFENIQKANLICERIEKLKNAKEKLDKLLGMYNGDSDGTGARKQKLYGFHLSEYSDGSGSNSIDLTGCMIGYEILQELEAKINKQINKDLAELETL